MSGARGETRHNEQKDKSAARCGGTTARRHDGTTCTTCEPRKSFGSRCLWAGQRPRLCRSECECVQMLALLRAGGSGADRDLLPGPRSAAAATCGLGLWLRPELCSAGWCGRAGAGRGKERKRQRRASYCGDLGSLLAAWPHSPSSPSSTKPPTDRESSPSTNPIFDRASKQHQSTRARARWVRQQPGQPPGVLCSDPTRPDHLGGRWGAGPGRRKKL